MFIIHYTGNTITYWWDLWCGKGKIDRHVRVLIFYSNWNKIYESLMNYCIYCNIQRYWTWWKFFQSYKLCIVYLDLKFWGVFVYWNSDIGNDTCSWYNNLSWRPVLSASVAILKGFVLYPDVPCKQLQALYFWHIKIRKIAQLLFQCIIDFKKLW